MLRPRGNLNFSRKPGIDPIIGNELSKIARSVPNMTYGDQFPGRQSTFGDMHFYTGEDTTSYKKNNWYIRPVDADSDWHPMNATSVRPENIQAGVIGHGVKVTDSLSLYGGEMAGKIIFYETQTFKPEMMESGVIPLNVSHAGYVPALGGHYLGDLDMTDHSISSIKKLFGLDNLIYIDMSVDGHLTLGADDHISFTAPFVSLGAALFTSLGVLTGASGLISMWTNDVGYVTDAPSDGFIYGRKDATWERIVGNVDGGFANSVYLVSQNIDGGGA